MPTIIVVLGSLVVVAAVAVLVVLFNSFEKTVTDIDIFAHTNVFQYPKSQLSSFSTQRRVRGEELNSLPDFISPV